MTQDENNTVKTARKADGEGGIEDVEQFQVKKHQTFSKIETRLVDAHRV